MALKLSGVTKRYGKLVALSEMGVCRMNDLLK